MSDWENSDSDSGVQKTTAPSAPPKKSKWEGEDEDNDNVASDWEDSSEEEEVKPATTAPAKKKGTVKAKIAEREALKASQAEASMYDEDDVLDPREKARRDMEQQLNADLDNAVDLFSGSSINNSNPASNTASATTSNGPVKAGPSPLDKLATANPKTKEEFQAYSKSVIELLIKKHQNKPLYAQFVEMHVRELAQPLKDVDVRKSASALTTLANEKQKEKAGPKKKTKAAGKPTLGSVKAAEKYDTNVYDEALDDFGSREDDFM